MHATSMTMPGTIAGNNHAPAFRRLLSAIAAHRRRQRDYRRLLTMPDFLLEDIGVTRGQVRAASRRTFP